MTKGTSKLGGLFATIKAAAQPTVAVAARSFVVACVGCGAPRIDGADTRACPFCGGDMIARPACRACGQALAPDAPACPQCQAPTGAPP